MDPHKLETYSVTVPQVLNALGNANVNVGGREIRIGQQSINIRGVGLIDDGGNDDLTHGNRLDDINNVVLTQTKRRSGVAEGCRQGIRGLRATARRLGPRSRGRCGGRHRGDEPRRPTRRHAAQGQGRNRGDEPRREPASGVKVVPIYDRGRTARASRPTPCCTTSLLGCLLVFLIQWMFLGDLRSAIIVGVNIPFALLFAIILLVMQGESANLLSLGAVDFGIIVDSAVILVENMFRNFQRACRGAGSASAAAACQQGPGDQTRPVCISGAGPWMDRSLATDFGQRRSGG